MSLDRDDRREILKSAKVRKLNRENTISGCIGIVGDRTFLNLEVHVMSEDGPEFRGISEKFPDILFGDGGKKGVRKSL
jgi:hypothetical protein